MQNCYSVQWKYLEKLLKSYKKWESNEKKYIQLLKLFALIRGTIKFMCIDFRCFDSILSRLVLMLWIRFVWWAMMKCDHINDRLSRRWCKIAKNSHNKFIIFAIKPGKFVIDFPIAWECESKRAHFLFFRIAKNSIKSYENAISFDDTMNMNIVITIESKSNGKGTHKI